MPTGEPIPVPIDTGTSLDNPLAHQEIVFSDLSQNVIMRDKEFQTRPGLKQLGDTIDEISLGGFSLRDQSNVSQLVIASETTWYIYNSTAGTWDDIHNGSNLLTNSVSPTTFTYWFQGGHQYVIGVNDKDATKEYDLTAAGDYADCTNAYIARTVATITNRLVYGNLLISGTRYPQDVAWSSVADRNTYPALARNTLADTPDHIMVIMPLGRSAGVVLKEHSEWLMISQPGSDASAFQFLLVDQMPGPIGEAAATLGPGGMQVPYFGKDGNIYTFNGVQTQLLAETQKLVENRINVNTQRLTCARYLHRKGELWIAVPLDDDTLPTHLLIYSYHNGKVYLGRTPGAVPITFFSLYDVEFQTAMDDLPDIAMDDLPDIPMDELGISEGGDAMVSGSATKVFTWEGSTDDSVLITNDWRFVLPVKPGQEYVFDGVDLQFEPTSTSQVQVSVFVGDTYDAMTETILTLSDGTAYIVPSENQVAMRSSEALRGRVVVLRISAQASLKLRRAEFYAWPRRMLAQG